jgi:hypothetical protein
MEACAIYLVKNQIREVLAVITREKVGVVAGNISEESWNQLMDSSLFE